MYEKLHRYLSGDALIIHERIIKFSNFCHVKGLTINKNHNFISMLWNWFEEQTYAAKETE